MALSVLSLILPAVGRARIRPASLALAPRAVRWPLRTLHWQLASPHGPRWTRRSPPVPRPGLLFSDGDGKANRKKRAGMSQEDNGSREEEDGDGDGDEPGEDGDGPGDSEKDLAHRRRLGEMAALISNPRAQDPPVWVNDTGSLLSREQRGQLEALSSSLLPINSQLVTVTLSIEQHEMKALGDLRPLAHSLFAEWDIGGERDKPRSILMLAVRAKDSLDILFGWGPDPVVRLLPLAIPSSADPSAARPVDLAQSVLGPQRRGGQASGLLLGGFPTNVSGDGEMLVQVARAVVRVLNREHNGRRRTLWGEPTICLQPHASSPLAEAERRAPRQTRLLVLLLQALAVIGLIAWSAQPDPNRKPPPRPPCPRCKAEGAITMRRGPTPTTATITCSKCGLQQDVARPLRTPSGDMVSASAPLSELELAMGPPSGLTGSPRGTSSAYSARASPPPAGPTDPNAQLPPLPADSLGLAGQTGMDSDARGSRAL